MHINRDEHFPGNSLPLRRRRDDQREISVVTIIDCRDSLLYRVRRKVLLLGLRSEIAFRTAFCTSSELPVQQAFQKSHMSKGAPTLRLISSTGARVTPRTERCALKMTMTTLQPLAYAVAYVTFFFGIISTILRFYCRQYVLKIWGLDDYVAVAILVSHSVQQIQTLD
jgi:hypothetical protein